MHTQSWLLHGRPSEQKRTYRRQRSGGASTKDVSVKLGVPRVERLKVCWKQFAAATIHHRKVRDQLLVHGDKDLQVAVRQTDKKLG